MPFLSPYFGAIIILFSSLSSCDEGFALVPRVDFPPIALRFTPNLTSQKPYLRGHLSGRALLDSWLRPRQETCTDAGYSPCTNTYGCCPTGGSCCSLGCCDAGESCCGVDSCVKPDETCCEWGTCPSGWDCCSVTTCSPKGGQCCKTGEYCTPGNVCVLVNGLQRCCTDTSCTAYVAGGVTVGGGGALPDSNPTDTGGVAPPLTTVPAAASTTPMSPKPTTPATVSGGAGAAFTYYYFTITYYYLSWYITSSELPVVVSTTTITFSAFVEITTSTTISVYETNSESAYESFLEISDNFSTPTPVAATTALSALSTAEGNTAGVGVSEGSGTRVAGGVPTSTGSSGTSSKSDGGRVRGGLVVRAWCIFSMTVGVLMVWL